VEERAFSGAGRAHEGDELAAPNGQINAIERDDFDLPAFKFLGQIVCLDDDIVHVRSFSSAGVGDLHFFTVAQLGGGTDDQIFAAD
jgi:hypothetical protein